ncbi:clathrin, heavy chain b (Hc) isoform X3, partial [Silurus asotus]
TILDFPFFRIATIRRNTADLKTDITRLQGGQNNQEDSQQVETSEVTVHIGQTPGLTLSESLNLECLDKHLESLEQKRNELLIKKTSEYVPVRVKLELDWKMKIILSQRDELSAENHKLLLWNKQLTYLKEALGRWENSGRRITLPKLLSSELKHVSRMRELWKNDQTGFETSALEPDDPGKIKESTRLAFYVERFIELFEAADYETAAFQASMSPYGVLRNIGVMEKFKNITVHKGAVHPLLLFFRSLMNSAPAGKPLPEKMSKEGVRFALRHGHVELVMFGVSQHRLTFSEELGDLICSYATGHLRTVDTCLALAQIVYTACGVLRKAALSMCRRGLTCGALQFIHNHKEFTIDDVVFVLKELPSVALLQDLTRPCNSVPALMSVGFILHYLLDSELEDLGFQLLEQIRASGQGAFQNTILDDEMCSAEGWSEIAGRCEQTGRVDLAQEIMSTLLLNDGAVLLSPGHDSAQIMEHVFM